MIQAILEGRPIDQPAHAAGRWQPIVAALQKVYDTKGLDLARDCFERLKRGAPELEALLASAGPAGLVARDIYRALRLKAPEARRVLNELHLAGLIARRVIRSATGRTIETWSLLPSD